MVGQAKVLNVTPAVSMIQLTTIVENLAQDANVEGGCVAVTPAGTPRIDLYLLPANKNYRLSGVPVDQHAIIIDRPIVALGARMGSSTSIAFNACDAGTLGAVVVERTAPHRRGYITCNHVATAYDKCPTGTFTREVAPGTCDQPCCMVQAGTDIGEWVSSSDIADPGLAQFKADAAFVESIVVDPANDCGICATSTTPIAPSIGTTVMKCGRSTRHTCGKITGFGCTVRVDYCLGQSLRFVDQIRVESPGFSTAGDSGSVVYTDSGGGVGLLFAGDGVNTAFVNPMATVLDQLKVDLVPVSCGGQPKCPNENPAAKLNCQSCTPLPGDH